MRHRSCSLVTKAAVLLALAAGLVAVAPAPPSGADGSDAPGAPRTFRALTVGDDHSCALLQNGTVKCWGRNDFGQLGLGDIVQRGDNAGEMGASLPAVDLGSGRTATAISAGAHHTCALLDNGTVKCWGWNIRGQLGLGDVLNRGDGPSEMGNSLPAVSLGSGRTAVAISAGLTKSCAVLDNGTAKCWGSNTDGQLGQGDVLHRGDGPNEMGDNLPPITLGTGRTVTAISAGGNFACAILDNGATKCWGDNASGQLGQGDMFDRGVNLVGMGDFLPIVDLGPGRTAIAVSLGQVHACAVLDNYAVKCWGSNSSGQLGLGNTVDRGDQLNEMGSNLPAIDLGGASRAVGLATGDAHTCARLTDGRVKCWGDNDFGQLGQGDTLQQGDGPSEMGVFLDEVPLGAGRTATALATGAGHVCARLDDARIKCWGRNGFGQLGQGNLTQLGDNPDEIVFLPGVAVGTTQPAGISGEITDFNNTPLSGIHVAALRSTDFALLGGAVTDVTGQYSIELPGGSYYLYLIDSTDRWVNGFPSPNTLRTVTNGFFTDADLTMSSSRGRILGTVTEDGTGNPIVGGYTVAISSTGALEQVVPTDVSGLYSLNDLRPGSHYLGFLDPTGAHAAEFFPNAPAFPSASAVTVAANSVTVANDSQALQSLWPTGSNLSGTVLETGTGSSLANVVVIALRASDYRFVRAAVTNASGQYQMNVQTGGYYLTFVDTAGGHPQEWYNNQPNSGLATATQVTAPAITNADLSRAVGTITGTVRTAANNVGIDGAWVFAIGPSGNAAAGAATAPNGTYTLTGLAPGTYRVTFVDPLGGRPQEYFNNSTTYAGATTINVAAAATVNAIDGALG
jgi:alpha-tubulin suppressor-like RCC1 family protein